MSWRTVIVSKRSKLDYKLNRLVVRGETEKKINLSEISIIIIESTAVSLTAYLLCELVKRKIKVVFCDEKRNPSSELIGYYGCHDTSLKVKTQINWSDSMKNLVWTEIVAEKIRKQKELLEELSLSESTLLGEYIETIEYKDSTNREGHAAKVYFNALFGMDFTRSSENDINSALNYGYSILLSAFNREIVANGYITQIGLEHDNIFNQFNLSSDLMEPYRPIIDKTVYLLKPEKFDKEEKIQLVDVLNREVIIDGKKQYLNNAIKIYCKSVFDALCEEDVSQMRFYKSEL